MNLREDLENAAILSNLVPIQGKARIIYDDIVKTLAERFQKSLKEDPTIEIKVPEALIDEIQKGIQREVRKSCV